MPPLFYNMASVSSPIALCLLVFGTLSWTSNPVLRPVTVQCSDLAVQPLLVKQPRNHDDPTPSVTWSNWLGMTEISFCDGCSEAAALFLLCGFAAWCMRHIQFGQDLTRTLLNEALRARLSGFFVHVLSRNDRRDFWRSTRRSRSGVFSHHW